MPIELNTFQLPCGARCLRLDCIGDIGKAEADQIIKQTELGSPLHGMPLLALTERMGSLSADARGLFARSGEATAKENWTAVVITNPVIRVASNFLIRVNKLRKQRLFAKEADAVSWLDERIGEESGRGRG